MERGDMSEYFIVGDIFGEDAFTRQSYAGAPSEKSV